MLIDNIQAKHFIKFDFMKIMIHLAWVADFMVIFSASKHISESFPVIFTSFRDFQLERDRPTNQQTNRHTALVIEMLRRT